MSDENCRHCGRPRRVNISYSSVTQCEGEYTDAICLRSQLSAATARASELEKMLTAEWGLGCYECGAEWMTDAQLDKLSDLVEPLKALLAQRDTELAVMGERVALYRKGYEARGKILAAYRTGGRPSERALLDTAEAANALSLIAPEGKGE